MRLILQSNCADSGAIVQVWSERPLSSLDVDQLMHELRLLERQAQRREAVTVATALPGGSS